MFSYHLSATDLYLGLNGAKLVTLKLMSGNEILTARVAVFCDMRAVVARLYFPPLNDLL